MTKTTFVPVREPNSDLFLKPYFEVVIDKVAIYVVTEVRHGGWGRYRQRGRFIQGRYIQWALYMNSDWPSLVKIALKIMTMTSFKKLIGDSILK